MPDNFRAAWDEPGEARLLTIDASIVSDPEITELNRDFRHKNRPTDVLSFSQCEAGAALVPLQPDQPCPLGDLVISIETACRQAEERNHSLTAEMTFLTVHGTLHLWGYDHQNNSGRRTMFRLQDEIFSGLTLERSGPSHPLC